MNAGGALEWEVASSERLGAEIALRDGSASLLEQYAELLHNIQAQDNQSQHAREVRSAVLSTSMVQSAQQLLRLEDELRRASVLADHVTSAADIAYTARNHDAVAVDAHERLHGVAAEMHVALERLEDSYYSCSAGRNI